MHPFSVFTSALHITMFSNLYLHRTTFNACNKLNIPFFKIKVIVTNAESSTILFSKPTICYNNDTSLSPP